MTIGIFLKKNSTAMIPKPKSNDAFVVGGKDAISISVLNPSNENNNFSINISVSPSAKISLPIVTDKINTIVGRKGIFSLNKYIVNRKIKA